MTTVLHHIQRFATATVCAICTITSTGETIDRSTACEIIDAHAKDPIAGLWRMGNDGGTFAIIPANGSNERFDIVLIDSPDLSAIPGRIIGTAVSTGKSGTYDASFHADPAKLKRTAKFILTLGTDGRLVFSSYKQGKRISLRRWLPYLFRIRISEYDTRPASTDGAIRIYPEPANSGPVML